MYRWWQACIALLVGIGFASILNGVLNRTDQGTFGITFSSQPNVTSPVVVASVDPNSPAFRAGIRAGDRLRIAQSLANRIALYATVPGDRITVNDGERVVGLVASASNSSPPGALIAVVELARLTFLVMAALIAWRRPEDAPARALAILLACFGVGLTFDVTVLPWVWSRFVLLVMLQTLFLGGALAGLAFATRFPMTSQRGLRAFLDKRLQGIVIVGVGISILTAALLFALPIGTRSERVVADLPFMLFYIAVIVATFAALIAGYRASRDVQRVRARWALGTIVIGLSGMLAFLIAAATGNGGQAAQYLVLTMLVIPFGLAYAIFRHRMLDITFVINLAVVYTFVSVVIVGSFILFEWLLGLLVEQNSRASLILQLLAALALGLSTRFIHARVDRFVDNLFFRERHAAEAAVRRFAHEAGLITTVGDLVGKTVEIAQISMRLRGAAFYALRDGAFVPLYSTIPSTEAIDENDYAVLEMRTWHAPVEPAIRGSNLRGDVAFPMMVRGSLAGFLLCGEKETREMLAPDERDALGALANSCGVALDSLRVRALEVELKDLSEDASLPQSIRAKLSLLSVRQTA